MIFKLQLFSFSFTFFWVPWNSNIFSFQWISLEIGSCHHLNLEAEKQRSMNIELKFSMVLVPSDGLQFTDGNYSVDLPHIVCSQCWNGRHPLSLSIACSLSRQNGKFNDGQIYWNLKMVAENDKKKCNNKRKYTNPSYETCDYCIMKERLNNEKRNKRQTEYIHSYRILD